MCLFRTWAKTFLIILSSFGLGIGASQAKEPVDFINSDIQVKSSYEIPTDKLVMIELANGEVILATGDGKYIIKNATVFSTMHTKIINSPEELYQSTKIDLKKMRFKPEKDLIGFPINESGKYFGGTLYVSPNCANCEIFLKQLQEQHSDKRFFIAIAPVLSDVDYENAILAQCSAEPTEAIKAMYYGSFSASAYPREEEKCTEAIKKVNYTVASLKLLSPGQMGIPSFFNNGSDSIIGLPTSPSKLTTTIMQGIDL